MNTWLRIMLPIKATIRLRCPSYRFSRFQRQDKSHQRLSWWLLLHAKPSVTRCGCEEKFLFQTRAACPPYFVRRRQAGAARTGVGFSPATLP